MNRENSTNLKLRLELNLFLSLTFKILHLRSAIYRIILDVLLFDLFLLSIFNHF
jgi:hypothetical protein